MTASHRIDFKGLRRTLDDLGFMEPMPVEAGPLVHHLLASLFEACDRVVKQHGTRAFFSSFPLDTHKCYDLANEMALNESMVLEVVERSNEQMALLQQENARLRAQLAGDQPKKGGDVDYGALLPFVGHCCRVLGVAAPTPAEVRSFAALSPTLERVREALGKREGMLKGLQAENQRLQQAKTEQERQLGLLEGELAEARRQAVSVKAELATTAAQLNSVRLELSLAGDLALQVQSLDQTGRLLQERLGQLQASGSGHDAHAAGLLETLLAELGTESAFTSHLTRTVERLNRERLELEEKLRLALQRAGEAEQEAAGHELRVASLGRDLEAATARYEALKLAASSQEQAHSGLRTQLEQRQLRLETEQRTQAELRTALEAARASLASLRQQEACLATQSGEQERLTRDLRARCDQLQLERDQASMSAKLLQQELDTLNGRLDQRQRELEEIAVRDREATLRLEQAKVLSKASEARVREMEERLAARSVEREGMMAAHVRLVHDNDHLKAELAKLKSTNTTNTPASNVGLLQTRINHLEQELQRVRAHEAKLEERLRDYSAQLAEQRRRQPPAGGHSEEDGRLERALREVEEERRARLEREEQLRQLEQAHRRLQEQVAHVQTEYQK